MSEFGQDRYPEECPVPLRGWADSLVGTHVGRTRRLRIAGWRWDGHSPTVRFLLAPTGEVFRDIPLKVWRSMQ